MNTLLLIVSVVQWMIVLVLGFLVLGALRLLARLTWQLEELKATTPNRLGRSGLKPGKKAPDFTLPGVAGADVCLHAFAGRKVLVVFMQAGCGPCHRIVPELNRLHDAGEMHVLAVNNGDREGAGKWATEVQARFPVAVQERYSLSRRFEVFATPFAFLIDERAFIVSRGIVNNKQHLGFVLSGARGDRQSEADEAEPVGAGAEVA